MLFNSSINNKYNNMDAVNKDDSYAVFDAFGEGLANDFSAYDMYTAFDVIAEHLKADNITQSNDYYDLSDEEAKEIFEDSEADRQIAVDKEG